MVREDKEAWEQAIQQACAIAFNKDFETPEDYTVFVLDLADELYEKIVKGEL